MFNTSMPRKVKPHEPRAAVIAILNPNLLRKVAQTSCIVSADIQTILTPILKSFTKPGFTVRVQLKRCSECRPAKALKDQRKRVPRRIILAVHEIAPDTLSLSLRFASSLTFKLSAVYGTSRSAEIVIDELVINRQRVLREANRFRPPD